MCGGCHESRAGEIAASTTIAQQVGPSRLVKSIAERLELPWAGASAGAEVQDVFDAKCVSCHAGGAGDPFADQSYTVTVLREDSTETESYVIPLLDLSARPLNAYYEREAVTYPASYVTLLFPSAMMGDIRVEGAPTEWVFPGNARRSRLIAKLNINAVVYDASGNLVEQDSWAFPTPAHPEDKGVTVTREERLTLIRAIDLGGQYYARRNVGGGVYTGMDYQP